MINTFGDGDGAREHDNNIMDMFATIRCAAAAAAAAAACEQCVSAAHFS